MTTTNLSTSNSEKKEYKRFFLKLLLLSPTLVMLVGINYFIDPAGLYRPKTTELKMARILASGKNIGQFDNCDERLFRKYTIQVSSKKAPDVAVIGSSRSMQIGKIIFPHFTIKNYGVSGASVEDLLGLVYLQYQARILPKTMIIGVDPWMLNKNNGQTRFVSIEKEMRGMCRLLDLSCQVNPYLKNNTWTNLVSPSYFQASIKALRNSHAKQKSLFFPTTLSIADYAIMKQDGTLSYGKNSRNKTDSDVTKEAVQYAQGKKIYSLANFNAFDSQLQLDLEKLIYFLKQNHVNVVLYLPPYHPAAYKIMLARPEGQMILATEQYYHKLGKTFQLPVIGSYNPESVATSAPDFLDAMHLKDEGVKKIFANTVIIKEL